eukprot:jgi/Bigna1/39626/e_gw1.34.81.1
MSSEGKLTVLVASATANTGSKAVMALSKKGNISVRAMARNVEKAKKMLGNLPNVTIVKGDFGDEKSMDAALEGVSRAMLVCGPGKHEQYDYECDFLLACKRANVEGIVRISTYSCLIHRGTRNVYARAHSSIEGNIEVHGHPVVDLNPNWFMDNILSSAGEMKAAGTMSWPVKGDAKNPFIDTRDVGNAAAEILASDSETLKKFIAAKKIELHGPEMTSFQDQIAKLSKAVGYEIKIKEVPGAAWVGALMGFGMSKLFANSLLETVNMCEKKKKTYRPVVAKTSELMLSIYKPQYTINDWVKLPHVQGAMKK